MKIPIDYSSYSARELRESAQRCTNLWLEPMLKSVTEESGGNVQPLRTDAVIAAELRGQISPLLDQLCNIISQARAEGYEVAWSILPDSFGRHLRVTEIAIKKQL